MHEVKFKWLWELAERMDWEDRFPRSFWRWLLKRLDTLNGCEGMDYDY